MIEVYIFFEPFSQLSELSFLPIAHTHMHAYARPHTYTCTYTLPIFHNPSASTVSESKSLRGEEESSLESKIYLESKIKLDIPNNPWLDHPS